MSPRSFRGFPPFLLVLLLVLGLAGCALDQTQRAAQETDAALQAVQAAKVAADAQVAELRAQLTADTTARTVTDLQRQIASLQGQLATATTQPEQAVQVTQLKGQIADLEAKLASVPNAQTVQLLQERLKRFESISAQADPYLAKLTATAATLHQQLATAQNATDATVIGLQAGAGVSSLIPGYGSLIGIALGAIATGIQTWRKSRADQIARENAAKAEEAKAAATSIIQSFEAAKGSGAIVLTEQAAKVLNAVQTPAAKAFVDAVQKK